MTSDGDADARRGRERARPAREIEVFADVTCPFTHVGLRRLVERREAESRDVPLRVRAWPLELVNGTALDPEVVAEEVADLRAQIAPDLFAGFDPRHFPATSMPALVLAASAYGHGARVGERVSLALRHALFEEGGDIARPEVLLDIAVAAGIPLPEPGSRARVLRDWREGGERGVVGSPHFFVGADGWFCPTLDVARVDGHLRITRDEQGLAEFLDACFA